MPETAAPRLTRAEAARRNGARSRGPKTPGGKARSARNALEHGPTAQAFALLPGEDGEAYAQLLAGLTRRYRPAGALAAHLVRRLASVMWRQRRADRLEAEVLTQLEQRHDSSYLGGYVPSSPRTWDAARFSAVQRQQARLDRTLFRLLDELDRLTPADAEEPANDDEEVAQNEPDEPPPAVAAAVPAPPASPPEPAAPARLSGTDLLPLTPELAALPRGRGDDEEAGQLFLEGRVKQVNDFLRAMGRGGERA